MACCVFYLQNCTKKHYIYTTNTASFAAKQLTVHNICPTNQTYHKHPSATDTIQCINVHTKMITVIRTAKASMEKVQFCVHGYSTLL
ncbi:hypothetical protein NP493_1791g00002 [Ridgeia piscesae]|uniref:Uncharacterized protein n=1 Tax=Ridgeia piscesae TaxID=27915 RepID=A0AAD9N7Q8_RIDPI|nr:hypothetical protein NP493_1791g00002 [Ridgeia piscesae]